MKPIYIRRHKTERKNIYFGGIVFLILFFVCLRISAPFILESYINKSGSDNKGYFFRVGDIHLKVLKGQLLLNKFSVHKENGNANYVEARGLTFNFNPIRIFQDEKIFSVNIKSMDVLISKDMFDEVKRVKNESKEKVDHPIYLKKIKAKVGVLDVKGEKDNKAETLLTLKNVRALLEDFGVGSINKNTKFDVSSAIKEGGRIDLKGKTKLEHEKTPWAIAGKLRHVSPQVIEKLAGNKLPIEIEAADVDADIVAKSENGLIEGEIVPKIKEFKMAVDKDAGVIKKSAAKAANLLFEKFKKEDDVLTFALPFTLNENFTVNVPQTWDKIQRR